MTRKGIIWLYVFLIAILTDIAFILEHNNELRFFSKPLVILPLGIYFYQISRSVFSTLLAKTILSALVFSWIGDILLLWEEFFLFGLAAFLIAQVCYIIGFKVAQKAPESLFNYNFVKAFFINLPIYIIAAYLYYLINPNLGGYKIPVIVYTIAIVSMVTTARERFGKSNSASFWQVFIGASLFFISDGLIAINRFYVSFPEADVLVMGTYAIAQLLIVMGIRAHLIQPQ
ncbi:lysoplasmalogenase [Algoriphagus marinus]|uniref:lysoplasmalogenase n=1 Tax=Algoriphagus marinus TaxID=1925762 RepID=UPI00094B7E4D|nr:lysoplasmalogenase [Algoriphagus marinus]